MTARIPAHSLQVADVLHQFINTQVLPGTGVESAAFWQGFDALVRRFGAENAALLAERDRLQKELDTWHQAHPGPDCRHGGLPAVFDPDWLHGSAPPGCAGHHRKRGCRAGHHGWPPAGGAHPERPLRPERRQRPLGLAVRRAVRYRCHRRSQRRRKRQGLQPRSRR